MSGLRVSVIEECGDRGLPAVVDVEVRRPPADRRLAGARQLTVRFTLPVRGPLVLGRLSKLGLGQLVPQGALQEP